MLQLFFPKVVDIKSLQAHVRVCC